MTITRRFYPCGCYRDETDVLQRAPNPNYHGPATLIRHRTWGDHNPNHAHPHADRTAVRARASDTWPGRP